MDMRINGDGRAPESPQAPAPGPAGRAAASLAPAALRQRDTRINAFLEVFEAPLGGGVPGTSLPLDGLTFAVKEVIDVAGRRIPWGVTALKDRVAQGTAPAVSRILAGGALCLGTTRSTALAITGESGSRNPRDPARSPGGSSAGSAAAVGAGLVDVALGTQTVGSIIRPAAYCGVVGFKPTMGVVPRDGTMLLSADLDHLGYLARDVDVVKMVHGLFQPSGTPRSIQEVCVVAPWFDGGVVPEAMNALERAAGMARTLGYPVRTLALPPEVAVEEEAVLQEILARGIHDNHGHWITENEDHLPPGLAELARRGAAVDDRSYRTVLERRDGIRAAMAALVGPDTVLLTLSVADRPPLLGMGTGRRDPQRLWTLLGWPAVALPTGSAVPEPEAGTALPLPTSVQLIGPPGRDFDLLDLAGRMERGLLGGG